MRLVCRLVASHRWLLDGLVASSPLIPFEEHQEIDGPQALVLREWCPRRGKYAITGIQAALKESQHYPRLFGEYVVRSIS